MPAPRDRRGDTNCGCHVAPPSVVRSRNPERWVTSPKRRDDEVAAGRAGEGHPSARVRADTRELGPVRPASRVRYTRPRTSTQEARRASRKSARRIPRRLTSAAGRAGRRACGPWSTSAGVGRAEDVRGAVRERRHGRRGRRAEARARRGRRHRVEAAAAVGRAPDPERADEHDDARRRTRRRPTGGRSSRCRASSTRRRRRRCGTARRRRRARSRRRVGNATSRMSSEVETLPRCHVFPPSVVRARAPLSPGAYAVPGGRPARMRVVAPRSGARRRGEVWPRVVGDDRRAGLAGRDDAGRRGEGRGEDRVRATASRA